MLRIKRDWLEEQLVMAFFAARKGKLATADEYIFEMNWRENISLLAEDIIHKRYKPSRGISFMVKKPVKREIFAAPFRDRVVHHFIYNMVYDWWDRRLSARSFSCRVGKGTLYGIKRMQKDMRQVSLNGKKKAYVLKFDLQGYFMSLSRKKLYDRAKRGLLMQFPEKGNLYELLKYLWREIIFDDPVDGVRIRPSVLEWADLPSNKSLFCQMDGYGIVIGNLSSQLLSNIYMDMFDRFVTMELKYKHYGRYVDDFYIIVPEEEYPQTLADVRVMEEYLMSIGLKLHPKKRYIQPVTHGCEFLGMWVNMWGLHPSKRFKGNFYRALRAFVAGIGKMEAVVSYCGYMNYMDDDKFYRKMLNSVGWDC